MKKKNITETILPAETSFYTVPFENPDQCLTREMLSQHYPAPRGTKSDIGNRIVFISYDQGIVSTRVFFEDGQQNMLYLYTGLHGLHVSCSCGMLGERLCLHAFMGLNIVMWRGYFDFRMYYWPDFGTDDRLKKKFLNVEVCKERIFVEERSRYGRIFRPDISFGEGISLIEKSLLPERNTGGRKRVIGYCMVYTFGLYHSSHLPILLPVSGITGKDGSAIVSFREFIIEENPERDTAFTASQRQINRICHAQLSSSKKYEALGEHERHDALPAHKKEMLALWQEAIPLLLKEKYCYSYLSYSPWLGGLKGRPKKSQMEKCSLGSERPALSFILKFMGDHFSLSASTTVNGVPLKSGWYKPHLFIFDERKEICYVTSSVQDDDLLIWLWAESNRITVLKEHFREFHERFLEKAAFCYEVLFSCPGSGKKSIYDFETVLEEFVKVK
jgi:hypothetical protein